MRAISLALQPAMLLLSMLAIGVPATAQEPGDAVVGIVVDSVNGEPVADAEVHLVRPDGSIAAQTFTDVGGRFRFQRVPAGRYQVRVRRIGYASNTSAPFSVGEGEGPTVRVTLSRAGLVLEDLVVSVKRGTEGILDAPASVSVVSREQVADAVQLTPVDPVRTQPGVDNSNKGLIQRTFAVRGDRSANSGAMLMLTDYRYAGVPSLAFNVPYLVPLTPDDIERIEVVRGPGSALYGPNAHRGVLHVITRSPFESRGASLSLVAGERSVVQGTGRVAVRLSDRFAMKVSGDYFRGDDWEYADPAETVARDFAIERGAAEGRLDWRPNSTTTLSTTFGWAQAFNLVDAVSAVGGVQVRDWSYSYVQARVSRARLSANVMYNWSDAGRSLLLRSGAPLVDNSRVVAGQVQHGMLVGGQHEILYGLDARYTEPRTGGTIHGRYENDDEIAEVGAYVHGRATLTPAIDLIAALRGDYHDRLGDAVLSPRLGVVWRPAPEHALRLTYNRAFNSPDPGDLFPDVVVRTLTPLPYDVRLLGTPRGGFHFRQNGALCMRSPFVPDPTACLLPDATVTWDSLVTIAGRLGVDLSLIPRPDRAQVHTAFGTIVDESTVNPVDTASLGVVAPDRRTITSAIELGYKGLVGQAVFVAVDVYHSWIKDLFGPPSIGTPSAFFEEQSLAAYLDDFMPVEDAQAIAQVVAQLPAGTITPWESGNPDLLVLEPQGGTVRLWGVDVAVTADLSTAFMLSGSYSWVSDDSIPNVAVAGSYVLNGPRNKATAGLTYRPATPGVRAGIEGRWVSSFPVVSGEYRGRVDDYVVLDVRLGVPLPRLENVEISLDALNVLDNRHREFVGVTEIGRLVIGRLHASF